MFEKKYIMIENSIRMWFLFLKLCQKGSKVGFGFLIADGLESCPRPHLCEDKLLRGYVCAGMTSSVAKRRSGNFFSRALKHFSFNKIVR